MHLPQHEQGHKKKLTEICRFFEIFHVTLTTSNHVNPLSPQNMNTINVHVFYTSQRVTQPEILQGNHSQTKKKKRKNTATVYTTPSMSLCNGNATTLTMDSQRIHFVLRSFVILLG